MQKKNLPVLGLGLIAAAFAGCAATPKNQAVTVIPQPANFAAKPGEVTCQNVIHEGQLIAVKECHTQAQWDRIRHEYSLKPLDDIQRNSLTGRMR